MRALLALVALALSTLLCAQTHDLKPAEAMQSLGFLKGNWTGKQDFNTGGAAMVGEATNRIEEAIGGRYLAEMLSTTLPGRKATDTRHFISYDPAAKAFRAWWFTDTSVGPMEFEGAVDGKKLTLISKPTAPAGNVMRAIYQCPADDKLVYTLELKDGENWRLLFTTTYQRK
jgi:hypothetical protein